MGSAPIPGWYHDPDRAGWLRRWDGSGWVDEWMEAPTATAWPEDPVVHQPAPPPSSNVRPRRKRRWVIAVAVGSALAGLAGAIGVTWAVTADGSSDQQAQDRAEATVASEDESDPDGGRLIDRCGESNLLEIPGTDVSIEPMTLEQERRAGTDVRAAVAEAYTTSDDSATQSTLDGLLAEIRAGDSAIPFTVTLLDSNEVNAFAIPGGDLFFTTEIASMMTDDELAFVMGHEVAHVTCRHLAKQFEREALVMAGVDALMGTDIDSGRLYAEAAADVLNDVAGLSFSRDDETQADVVALDLLVDADRPLDAGPSALRVLQGLEGAVEPSALDVFLSTHPPTAQRIERLEAEIAER